MSPPINPSDIPGLAELKDLFEKANFVLNPVVALIELSSVDVGTLRAKAQAWGVDATSSRVEHELGSPDGVAADLLVWKGRLEEHWQSPALRGAEKLLTHATDNLQRESEFAPQIGAELTHLADTLEVSALDVLGLLLAAAGAVAAMEGIELAALGLVLAAVGVVTTPELIGLFGLAAAVASWILAVASLVIAAGAYVVAYIAVLKPRIDKLTEAGELFDHVASARNAW